MKIFRIDTDWTRFRAVNFDTLENWPVEHVTFDATSRSDFWTEKPDGYFVDPRKELGDFNHFLATVPVVGGRLLEDDDIMSIIDMSGESLSIQIGGTKFFLWNITECINALSVERSTYQYPATRSGRLMTPCLKTTRFGVSSVFKIPETRSVACYCFSDGRPLDFYRIYHERGYTGLKFSEILTE
jgi:hypothetical protein